MPEFNTFRLGDAIQQGQTLAANQFRLQQAPQEARDKQLESAIKKIDFVTNMASGMQDEDSYQRGKQMIQQAGIPVDNFPPTFDPNWLQENMQRGIGFKGQLQMEMQRLKSKQQSAEGASSRYKFGQVTREGKLTALDTETGKMVVFDQPPGETNLIDRPYLTTKRVTPEGEEITTVGPRGTFPVTPQEATTKISETQKTKIGQRGARAVIDRADQLVDKLWTAEGSIASRTKQAARLKGLELSQSDPDVAQYISLREGFLAPIIRALGEKGTLAEGDIGRARELWPSFSDSKAVAKGKLRQVQRIFDGVLTGQYESLEAAIQANGSPGPQEQQSGIKFLGFK